MKFITTVYRRSVFPHYWFYLILITQLETCSWPFKSAGASNDSTINRESGHARTAESIGRLETRVTHRKNVFDSNAIHTYNHTSDENETIETLEVHKNISGSLIVIQTEVLQTAGFSVVDCVRSARHTK